MHKCSLKQTMSPTCFSCCLEWLWWVAYSCGCNTYHSPQATRLQPRGSHCRFKFNSLWNPPASIFKCNWLNNGAQPLTETWSATNPDAGQLIIQNICSFCNSTSQQLLFCICLKTTKTESGLLMGVHTCAKLAHNSQFLVNFLILLLEEKGASQEISRSLWLDRSPCTGVWSGWAGRLQIV